MIYRLLFLAVSRVRQSVTFTVTLTTTSKMVKFFELFVHCTRDRKIKLNHYSKTKNFQFEVRTFDACFPRTSFTVG